MEAMLNKAIVWAPEITSANSNTKVSTFETDLTDTLEEIKQLLLTKNRKYGDSALNPVRIFSKLNSIEQIKIRLDDKLSRLVNQQNDEDEDVELDALGYLILLKIARKRSNN